MNPVKNKLRLAAAIALLAGATVMAGPMPAQAQDTNRELLPGASVSISSDPGQLVAGVPATVTYTVTLTNTSGRLLEAGLNVQVPETGVLIPESLTAAYTPEKDFTDWDKPRVVTASTGFEDETGAWVETPGRPFISYPGNLAASASVMLSYQVRYTPTEATTLTSRVCAYSTAAQEPEPLAARARAAAPGNCLDHEFPVLPPKPVTPVVPELLTATECGLQGSVQVPEVEGVKYTQSREGDTVTINAAAEAGYVLQADTESEWVIQVPAAQPCPTPTPQSTEPTPETTSPTPETTQPAVLTPGTVEPTRETATEELTPSTPDSSTPPALVQLTLSTSPKPTTAPPDALAHTGLSSTSGWLIGLGALGLVAGAGILVVRRQLAGASTRRH